LRQRRQALHWSLDDLAEKAKLNRATIHSIENIKREPNLKPDLVTVDRLTCAMGLTLSSFLAQFEEVPIEGLKPQPSTVHTRTEIEGGSSHGQQGVPFSDARIQESLVIAAAQQLAAAIERAADRLVAALSAARPPRQQAPAARPHAAVRNGRHRKMG
jgi:transcriptional regulator with XRE-family HTH domain